MRMVRAYLVEHPRTSLVTQLTNPALHERPLRGRFGSTRAGGPSRDERPERVGKSHWPRSGRTAGMGRRRSFAGLPTNDFMGWISASPVPGRNALKWFGRKANDRYLSC
jgi:hypothetical protein